MKLYHIKKGSEIGSLDENFNVLGVWRAENVVMFEDYFLKKEFYEDGSGQTYYFFKNTLKPKDFPYWCTDSENVKIENLSITNEGFMTDRIEFSKKEAN